MILIIEISNFCFEIMFPKHNYNEKCVCSEIVFSKHDFNTKFEILLFKIVGREMIF